MTSQENVKGILKSSKTEFNSKRASGAIANKSAKFDEINIAETLHPDNKDYGHQKIDEPKTPYSQRESQKSKPVDPIVLNNKLLELQKSEEAEALEKETFLRRRKHHYDEYKNIQLAKKLIDEDDKNTEDNN